MIKVKTNMIIFILMIFAIPMNGSEMGLKEELIQIDSEVGELIVIWYLKDSKLFLELEERAEDILKYADKILKDDCLSINQKIIYIFAIQNCDFNTYLSVLYNVAKDFRDGNIDEYIMKRLLAPFDWDYRVIKNYKNKDVREILDTCLDNPNQSDDFKEFLNSIKSGKYWKNFKKGQRIQKGFFYWLKLSL